MKLFYAPASPFARKVHASIIELGLQDGVEFIFTPVLPGKTNIDYARTRNPLGKIPALETDSGDTLFDSTIICEYLDSVSTGPKILPARGLERYQVLTRQALANGICDSAVAIRYETFLRPEPKQWDTWSDDHWGKIERSLEWFNSNASQWQGDVALDQITLACALGYLDFRSEAYDWREQFSQLAAWFETFSQRESIQSTPPTAQVT